jgi:hypothetical protein
VASIHSTLATAGTLAALGGLTAFAVGAGDARPEAEPAGTAAPAEEVRTEVVTRTIDRREPAGHAASRRSAVGAAGDRGRGCRGDDVLFDDHGDDGRRGRGPGGADEGIDDDGDDNSGGGHGRGGGDDD